MVLVLLGLVAASTFDIRNLDFGALLETGSQSNDAVKAVYDLLFDLKQSNAQAQAMADKKNITDEQIGSKVIGEITKMVNSNRNTW